MIGAIISQILGAGCPVEHELALYHAAEKPVEPRIRGLGALGDNVVIGDSSGGILVVWMVDRPWGHFIFYDSLV